MGSFRERLLAARRRSELTQNELGAKMVPPATKQQVHQLETDGNPTLPMIERLAAALAIDARWLAFGETPERTKAWQSEPAAKGAHWIKPRLEDGDPYWADHPQYIYRSGCPGSLGYHTSAWYFASGPWAVDGQPLNGRMVCPVEDPPK